MRITIKTKAEIKRMRESGEKLARVLKQVLDQVKPGIKLIKLEQLAVSLIENEEAEPNFKQVPKYHWATCININQGVVHGIPDDYKIRLGDLVSIDIGLLYHGFHADMARSVLVGTEKSTRKEKFLKAGEQTLRKAVQSAKAGNRVGHISRTIERGLKNSGYYPVKSLTGHGIGKKLHEPPSIPCFLASEIIKTPLLKAGMTIAIEVIYTQQETDLLVNQDGWTVTTKDGSLGGLFENTVLVTGQGGEVLTSLR